MEDIKNLDERKAVWEALSDLYLDTELQEYDFTSIASRIIESPYTINEIKEIDKYEIFPVLFSNLLTPAGEWAGFHREILFKNITSWIESRTYLDVFAIQCIYPIYQWMNEDYWKKIEEIYDDMLRKSAVGR